VLPVGEVLVGDTLGDGGHPRPVGERMANGGVLFAAGGELGPYRCDRVVEPDGAAVDELEQQRGDDGLADGVHVHERVVAPRLGRCGTADEVDHRLAVDQHAHGGPYVASLGEVVGERTLHGGSPLGCVAGGGDIHSRIVPYLMGMGK
jgi:hypothetical protein